MLSAVIRMAFYCRVSNVSVGGGLLQSIKINVRVEILDYLGGHLGLNFWLSSLIFCLSRTCRFCCPA